MNDLLKINDELSAFLKDFVELVATNVSVMSPCGFKKRELKVRMRLFYCKNTYK